MQVHGCGGSFKGYLYSAIPQSSWGSFGTGDLTFVIPKLLNVTNKCTEFLVENNQALLGLGNAERNLLLSKYVLTITDATRDFLISNGLL
jgi:hypothetical protein